MYTVALVFWFQFDEFMIFESLFWQESVPEIPERINMLRGLLSEIGLPEEIEIGLGLDQVAGKSVLRLLAIFPSEMFPLPSQLTDDIDRQV